MRGYKRKNATKGKPYKKSKTRLTSFKRPVVRSMPTAIRPLPAPSPGTVLRTKFIYCEKDIGLSPGLASADVKVFSLSSLNDPYVTGTGHQPTGFDQLMAIYEQFLILNARVTVKFSNTGAAASESQIVGLTVSDDAATTSDCRRYVENGNTVSAILSGRSDGTNVAELSCYADLPSMHGLTYAQYTGDDVYKGNGTTNPGEACFLHIWGQAIGVTDTADIQLFVEIEYTALLTGSKLNSLS